MMKRACVFGVLGLLLGLLTFGPARTGYAQPTPEPPTYCIEKEIALYGDLSQADLQVQLPNLWDVTCGPVAAVNSLKYLQHKYPSIYDTLLVPVQGNDLNGDGAVDQTDHMIAVAVTLTGAGYMNTQQPGGTWHDAFIYGKYTYLEEVARGLTRYEAQDPFQWGNPPAPGQAPGWVQPIYPTWDFLYGELVDCEDVEILINWTDGGHFLTLTSFCWTDLNMDGIIDMNEGAIIDYIDPATGLPGVSAIWQSTLYLETDYVSGAYISVAVSESPVPEPVTMAGLVLGIGSLVGYLRRRR